MPQETPPVFVKTASRRSLGSFAFEKSLLRLRWKALPVDISGKSSKANLTAYAKVGKPLFEVRLKNGAYEWADAEGNAIAVGDEGEEQQRLLVTVELQRETVDALVALWYCRLWQYSAENEAPLYSGSDYGKRSRCYYPGSK